MEQIKTPTFDNWIVVLSAQSNFYSNSQQNIPFLKMSKENAVLSAKIRWRLPFVISVLEKVTRCQQLFYSVLTYLKATYCVLGPLE